jgi:uroporphyrinogen-III synthase
VEVVEAYRAVRPEPSPELLGEVASADAVTFTSSSTVTGFLEMAGRDRLPPVIASIGPVTSATARAAGLEVTVEAREHTVGGLVEALAAHAASLRP